MGHWHRARHIRGTRSRRCCQWLREHGARRPNGRLRELGHGRFVDILHCRLPGNVARILCTLHLGWKEDIYFIFRPQNQIMYRSNFFIEQTLTMAIIPMLNNQDNGQKLLIQSCLKGSHLPPHSSQSISSSNKSSKCTSSGTSSGVHISAACLADIFRALCNLVCVLINGTPKVVPYAVQHMDRQTQWAISMAKTVQVLDKSQWPALKNCKYQRNYGWSWTGRGHQITEQWSSYAKCCGQRGSKIYLVIWRIFITALVLWGVHVEGQVITVNHVITEQLCNWFLAVWNQLVPVFLGATVGSQLLGWGNECAIVCKCWILVLSRWTVGLLWGANGIGLRLFYVPVGGAGYGVVTPSGTSQPTQEGDTGLSRERRLYPGRGGTRWGGGSVWTAGWGTVWCNLLDPQGYNACHSRRVLVVKSIWYITSKKLQQKLLCLFGVLYGVDNNISKV